MTDMQQPQNTGRSLLDEIEELDVLEAEELQEGVAFHAFKFHAAAQMESLELILNEPAVTKVFGLPQGATLLDVQGNKMRILFDPQAVTAGNLQALANASLGASLASINYTETDKFVVTKVKS